MIQGIFFIASLSHARSGFIGIRHPSCSRGKDGHIKHEYDHTIPIPKETQCSEFLYEYMILHHNSMKYDALSSIYIYI